MNKKKCVIGLIVILVVFIVVCFGVIIYRKHKSIIESDYKIAESSEENIIIEDEITDLQVEKIAEETIEENVEATAEKAEIPETAEKQEPTETKVNTTSQERVSSPSKKQSNPTGTQSQVKTETTNKTQVQTKTETSTKTETIQPTQTQVQIEQPKVTEEKKEVVTTSPSQNLVPVTKDEEKYVRNDTMINKIREVIKANESEYMKTYGYEIVVDSSIKEKTNQFTFTETRVKGYITYKFGTIKIYAEDYYRNGQLIMTECYIF